jgi:crotonobetainyl-CoA:carnitine CoA-transferase CaiB-like acyl-CoA transferase
MLAHYGRKGQIPPPLPTQVADIGAGSLHLVIGLLTAVIRRTTTGQGAHVDISMHDGSLAWNSLAAANVLVGGETPLPEGGWLNGGTYYDLYETQDGRLLSVGSLEPKFWAEFCTAIGRAELIERGLNWDLANQQAVKPAIRETIRRKTLAEWTAIFASCDACVEPVLTTREALDHPQTRARRMLVDVPRFDGSIQQQIGTPIKLSNHRPEYRQIGARPGAHTDQILTELGYTSEAVDRLKADGTVAGTPRAER